LLSDPLKIELAAELQKQTKLSMAWIAKELHAGAHTKSSLLLDF
jgi:hypothetical protein